ncbi:hypothetical protein CbuK_1750 [Coxiella burnetii CbuK_Q154]|nr:hypothetical protein CbuK_1750 [Coxiella burnetii CbuK_Q154]
MRLVLPPPLPGVVGFLFRFEDVVASFVFLFFFLGFLIWVFFDVRFFSHKGLSSSL